MRRQLMAKRYPEDNTAQEIAMYLLVRNIPA